MRELKILAVVVFFTLITYYGIEPFAHKEMRAHVEPASFNMEEEDINLANFRIQETEKSIEVLSAAVEKARGNEKDLKTAQQALSSAQKDLEINQGNLAKYQGLWAQVHEVSSLVGNAEKGAETFMMSCIACHGIKSQGMESPFDDTTSSEAYGVVVPDLSDAGATYDEKFLAALIIDPATALKLGHKFNNEDTFFPMTAFMGVNEDFNQDVADIIAYMKSIAPSEVSGRKVFESACQRCHDAKYDKLNVTTSREPLKNYMGSNPPDISMMIRSRGAAYLETFINDPQKNILGTAMPRAGLNEQSQEKLISYMEQIGDAKKGERATIGYFLMAFFAIMAVLAYFWKREVWKELH